jgi:hypothetical protein
MQFYISKNGIRIQRDAKDMKGTQRIIIYQKDIQRITGKKEKASRNLLKKIKKSLNKTEESFISLDEFCIYTGLDREEVIDFMKD